MRGLGRVSEKDPLEIIFLCFVVDLNWIIG